MTTTTPDPEQSFEEPRRRVDALEVSPETFDEIAGKLQRLRTEEPLIILGSIGLLRGPSKPVLLAEGDLEAIFARINGWDDRRRRQSAGLLVPAVQEDGPRRRIRGAAPHRRRAVMTLHTLLPSGRPGPGWLIRQLIRADGSTLDLPTPRPMEWLRDFIGADCLDTVTLHHLGKPLLVMLLDDNGAAKGLPVNEEATRLYHCNCKPGSRPPPIRGAVVIVPDDDFDTGGVDGEGSEL